MTAIHIFLRAVKLRVWLLKLVSCSPFAQICISVIAIILNNSKMSLFTPIIIYKLVNFPTVLGGHWSPWNEELVYYELIGHRLNKTRACPKAQLDHHQACTPFDIGRMETIPHCKPAQLTPSRTVHFLAIISKYSSKGYEWENWRSWTMLDRRRKNCLDSGPELFIQESRGLSTPSS